MKLTEAFKKWLTENCSVKADATDDEFKKAAGEALALGTLSTDEYVKLTAEPEEKEVSDFEKRMTSLEGNIDKLVGALTAKATEPEEKPEEKAAPKEKTETKTGDVDLTKEITKMGGSSDMSGEEKPPRVKDAIERYTHTKGALIYPEQTKRGQRHPLAGQRVKDFEGGREMDSLSQRDKAISGAWGKFLCSTAASGNSKSMGWIKMPEHDKEVILWAMDNVKWSGASDGGDRADIVERFLTPQEKQALIDDSTSGGLEAAPIVFDDDVIQTPLLHSELFPLVKQVPLDRGRRVEGVAVSTVTASWGGVDNTEISLFNTASYVSAFDTTIFRWEGAIRIGLDFLSDTPIDFSTLISQQYGERLLEDLDDVIATGDGATQPEGIMNKSGTTSVSFGSATTIGNYESLRYGVAKSEFRASVKNTAVFCGTETSFQRARAIPVGTSDARRLFGLGHFTEDYELSGAPYKINESLTNLQIFYAILGRYRMYRRRGLTIRTSTEGETLLRRNVMLMVATARYGGQAERGAVAAVTTDAPA